MGKCFHMIVGADCEILEEGNQKFQVRHADCYQERAQSCSRTSVCRPLWLQWNHTAGGQAAPFPVVHSEGLGFRLVLRAEETK